MRTHVSLLAAGVGAVATKELRGRMRGWRAFISLTLYVALLAGFTILVYFAMRRSYANGGSFGGTPFASASVGQSIFEVLMVIQTILVVFLAPAFTSGAISLEREKQTLDMLAATPVPSLAIVLGKLFSALAFVGMQILASVPLVAVVFVFGGIAPDDIVRGYLVLLVCGFGFGCIGLALSSITRRTQAATVLTWLMVLGLTLGTATIFALWNGIAAPAQSNIGMPQPAPMVDDSNGGFGGSTGSTGASSTSGIPQPPEWILWLNPGVAMGDVVCGAGMDPYSLECRGVAFALHQDAGQVFSRDMIIKGGAAGLVGGPVNVGVTGVVGGFAAGGFVADPTASATPSVRDRLWPKIAAAWLVVSLLLIAFSVVMVRPRGARRRSLRPGRPHLRRRRSATRETPA